MKTNIHFLSYLAKLFLEWEMFQKETVQKIKTHVLCSVTFFRKSCRLWENLEKKILYGGSDHKWQHGARALHAGYLRLQTKHSEYVIIIGFSTATMVARTLLIVKFYVHWLSRYISLCWIEFLKETLACVMTGAAISVLATVRSGSCLLCLQ